MFNLENWLSVASCHSNCQGSLAYWFSSYPGNVGTPNILSSDWQLWGYSLSIKALCMNVIWAEWFLLSTVAYTLLGLTVLQFPSRVLHNSSLLCLRCTDMHVRHCSQNPDVHVRHCSQNPDVHVRHCSQSPVCTWDIAVRVPYSESIHHGLLCVIVILAYEAGHVHRVYYSLHCCYQIHDKKQIKGRFMFAPRLRIQPIMVRKAWPSYRDSVTSSADCEAETMAATMAKLTTFYFPTQPSSIFHPSLMLERSDNLQKLESKYSSMNLSGGTLSIQTVTSHHIWYTQIECKKYQYLQPGKTEANTRKNSRNIPEEEVASKVHIF
jgi:hypothetical protein